MDLTDEELEETKKIGSSRIELEEDIETIKIIFKDLIRQYEKCNSLNVGRLPNGLNVIYTKIKITNIQIDFMKKFITKEIE